MTQASQSISQDHNLNDAILNDQHEKKTAFGQRRSLPISLEIATPMTSSLLSKHTNTQEDNTAHFQFNSHSEHYFASQQQGDTQCGQHEPAHLENMSTSLPSIISSHLAHFDASFNILDEDTHRHVYSSDSASNVTNIIVSDRAAAGENSENECSHMLNSEVEGEIFQLIDFNMTTSTTAGRVASDPNVERLLNSGEQFKNQTRLIGTYFQVINIVFVKFSQIGLLGVFKLPLLKIK